MSTFCYFAYGSNMLVERLQARCPSARAVGVGVCVAGEYDILFNKRSVDGSGKAAMVKIGDGRPVAKIIGVIYEVAVKERDILDQVEGDGYDRDDGVLVTPVGTSTPTEITSYLARPDALTAAIQPYDWYMALVIAGARQHGLPDAYVQALETVAVMPDPMPTRRRRQAALRSLGSAGFSK